MAYTQRGSGFVGLRDYLNLNRQQGEAMGNTLANRVEQETAAARGAVDAASADFASKVQAGTPVEPTMPTGLDSAEQEAWMRNNVTGIQYAGPKDFGAVADTKALASGLDKAATTAQLSTTDAGRGLLLNRNGTVGGRMLDGALAGRGGGERLATAGKGYDKLRDYLGMAQTNANAQVAQGEATAKGQRDKYAAEVQAGVDSRRTLPPGAAQGQPLQQRGYGTRDYLTMMNNRARARSSWIR